MISISRKIATPIFVAICSAFTVADAPAQSLHIESAEGFSRYTGGCVASSVTIQPDEKIVAAGWTGEPREQQLIVVRFNRDQTLDTEFGEPSGDARTGWKKIDMDGDAQAMDVEIDPKTGKILLVGSLVSDGDASLVLARLDSDGDVDTSFQDSGFLLHRFESQINEGSGFETQNTYGTGLTLDINGDLIATGRTGTRRDRDPFVSRFTNDGELVWMQKHGTSGFDDGANAVVVPMKEEPYYIYTSGFSVIINTLRRFTHDGVVKVGQSSLGFGQQAWGISYDETTGHLVTGANLGKDMIIREFDERPEVIQEKVFPNPFKEEKIDSIGRGFVHLAGGRLAVAGHGRPYDAKDNTDRRFLFALYEPSGSLVTHDRPDLGGAAAAYGIAAHKDSLIAVAGRVLLSEDREDEDDADEDEDSKKTTKFRMGFVLYDGDGNRIGDPWTFTP